MLSEQFGSRVLTLTRTGASATRIFYGTRADAIWNCPRPGEEFPEWPGLTVDTVTITPAGVPGSSDTSLVTDYTNSRVEVTYSLEYRNPALGDPPSITWDMSTEVLNTGAGRHYVDPDTMLPGDQIDVEDLSTATVYPMMSIAWDFAVPIIPLAKIIAALGKVNTSAWQGCAAETLLFEGANASAQYNYESRSWFFRVSYKFVLRMRSHNLIWRPGKRVWDKDNAKWTKNDDGTYVYVAGTEGEGDWVYTDPLLYETTDFEALTT